MAKQNNPEQLNHNEVHDAVPAFAEEDIAKLVHELDNVNRNMNSADI